MQTPLLKSLGGKLAERWVATLFTPAFAFWIGGTLLSFNWQLLVRWFIKSSDSEKLLVFIASLLLVSVTASIVERFDLAVLRFLEGYWPFWLRPLAAWKIHCHTRRFNSLDWRIRFLNRKQRNEDTPQALEYYHQNCWPPYLRPLRPLLKPLRHIQTQRQLHRRINNKNRLQTLNQKQTTHLTDRSPDEWHEYQTLQQNLQSGLTPQESQQLATLEQQLRRYRALTKAKMPTRLGNLLRATENRPQEKYGLNAVIVWPHLWLVLPENARTEVQTARADLNTAARVWLWSFLFLLWSPVSLWAIPIGLLLPPLIYYTWILSAAETYATLVEATFDLYRQNLYQALRWPLPQTPREEHAQGLQLTAYLWRGSDAPSPEFTSKATDSPTPQG